MKKLLMFLLLPCFAAQLPIDPEMAVGRLDNGVTYYACERDTDGWVTLRLVVPVGSVFEQEEEEGIAHFVEHLVFRGTEHFPEWEAKEFGGNAYTSFDETVYELDVPVENAGRALFLMAEWAQCATLKEAAIEAERGIVLEEWRMRLCADQRISGGVLSVLLEGSPYADRFPIGLESTIRRADQAVIRGFYERCYHGAPLAVVVVGDLPTGAMVDMVERAFGWLPQRREREPSFSFGHRQGKIHLTQDREVKGASVELLFSRSGGPVETEEKLRASLVRDLFHTLFENRLKEVAPRAGLGSNLKSSAFTLVRGLELDEICAECGVASVPKVLAGLIGELRRVQRDGFSDFEMTRSKHQAAEGVGRWHGSNALASNCVSHFLLGSTLLGPRQQEEICGRLLEAIEPWEVQAVAESLNLDACTVHVVVPEGWNAEGVIDQALELAINAELVPYLERPLPDCLMRERPFPGKIVGAGGVAPVDLWTLHFENGATVHLLPTFSGDGTVLLNATALGGLSEFAREQQVAARLATPLLNGSGVGGIAPADLERMLVGREASLHRFMTPYSRSVLGSARQEGLEELFQLVHLAFQGDEPSRELFHQLQRGWMAGAHEVSPEAIFQQELDRINRTGCDYFVPPRPEEIEAARFEFTAAVGQVAFRNPAEFTFCIAGDFDREEVQELAATYIGSLEPMQERWDLASPLEAAFPLGVTEASVNRGKDPRSIVQLTFPVSIEAPTPDHLELAQVCANIAGARVYELLRGRLSSTYHVDTNLEFLWPDTRHGLLAVRFVCQPEDAELLAGMGLRELRLLSQRGPRTDEVTDAIRKVRAKLQGARWDPSFWADELARYAQFQWDPISLARLDQRVEGLSKVAVRKMLEQILQMDNYTQVILLPSS